MTSSTALIVTLFFLAVGGLLVFSVYSYRRDRRRFGQSAGYPSVSAATPLETPGPRDVSASEARALTIALQNSGAQWPEILRALNPRQNSQVDNVLIAIRGPHLFDPYTGLTVIRHGCDVALSHDPKASGLSAFMEAKLSMDKVIRAGD